MPSVIISWNSRDKDSFPNKLFGNVQSQGYPILVYLTLELKNNIILFEITKFVVIFYANSKKLRHPPPQCSNYTDGIQKGLTILPKLLGFPGLQHVMTFLPQTLFPSYQVTNSYSSITSSQSSYLTYQPGGNPLAISSFLLNTPIFINV